MLYKIPEQYSSKLPKSSNTMLWESLKNYHRQGELKEIRILNVMQCAERKKYVTESYGTSLGNLNKAWTSVDNNISILFH